MSSCNTPVELGEIVRLNAQLSDGEDSIPKVVKAFIRDDAGALIGTLTLNHVGGGLFKNDSYPMPDIPFITAQYSVFESDGVTEDFTYNKDFDSFVLSADGITSSSPSNDEEFIAYIEDENDYTVEVENDSP